MKKRMVALILCLPLFIMGASILSSQAFAQEDLIQERFEEVNKANRDANIGAMTLSFVFLPSVDIMTITAMCIVLLAGGIMVSRGTAGAKI